MDLERRRRLEEALEKASEVEMDIEPPPKEFKKKCLNLETLDSYDEDELEANSSWWSQWVRNPLDSNYNGPKLSSCEVRKVAEEVGYKWKSKVKEICLVMDQGADLGILGEGRWKTEGSNTANAICDGEKLMDSLQASILLGHIRGPLTKDEVSELGTIKVIPMDTRPKPNGSSRIIINMSNPHAKIYDPELKSKREARVGDGVALSPNMGLSQWKEFEPCLMSTNEDFRFALYACGWKARFCKSDWAHAYKHVPVRREDWAMQCLKFGGRYFVETALTFGGGNSPSIYRMVASYVKEVAELAVGFDPSNNVMVLDDLCSVGSNEDEVLDKFFWTYRSMAKRMGVELAPLDDPGKAFSPCMQGEILGLEYDSVKWTWGLPCDKARRLLALLWKVLLNRGAESKVMLTLLGRLNHYMMVVGGRYQRGFLYSEMRGKEFKPDVWVDLDNNGCVQLWWWIVNIRVVIADGAPLLDPRKQFAVASLELFSDAAGGDSKRWKGWGAYCEEKEEYVMMKWPKFILENKLYLGQTWGSKLTLLEGYAALMGLLTWLPEVMERGSVVLRVDNIGFVYAFNKGHSRDLHIYTLVRAMKYVSEHLEFKLHVIHVSRRTEIGDQLVDHLSKGEVEKVMVLKPSVVEVVIWSETMKRWIRQPRVLWDLGRLVMLESDSFRDSVGKDYKADMRKISLLLKWKKVKKSLKRRRDEEVEVEESG